MPVVRGGHCSNRLRGYPRELARLLLLASRPLAAERKRCSAGRPPRSQAFELYSQTLADNWGRCKHRCELPDRPFVRRCRVCPATGSPARIRGTVQPFRPFQDSPETSLGRAGIRKWSQPSVNRSAHFHLFMRIPEVDAEQAQFRTETIFVIPQTAANQCKVLKIRSPASPKPGTMNLCSFNPWSTEQV